RRTGRARVKVIDRHAAAVSLVQRNSVPSTQMRCRITASRRAGHDRLLHSAAPGDLHGPGLEPGPFLRMQHALRCFVEHHPHHLISKYQSGEIDWSAPELTTLAIILWVALCIFVSLLDRTPRSSMFV